MGERSRPIFFHFDLAKVDSILSLPVAQGYLARSLALTLSAAVSFRTRDQKETFGRTAGVLINGSAGCGASQRTKCRNSFVDDREVYVVYAGKVADKVINDWSSLFGSPRQDWRCLASTIIYAQGSSEDSLWLRNR